MLAIPALIQDLRRSLTATTLVSEAADLPPYGQDFRAHRGVPGVVVRPRDPAEIATILRCAAAFDVPVVPRAAGTNLATSFVPSAERILLDLRELNRILRVDPERCEVAVQPGVVNGNLNAQLAPLGLCFSPDPASSSLSTIGGNIATNAGGPHCIKYGVTFHHVTGLSCALVCGDTMHLHADDAGPDLLGAVIGSEGTLAIITEATLRLRPLPEQTRTVLAVFANAEAAAQAVTAILATGVVPAAVEYADAAAIAMFDGYAPSGYPSDAGALVLMDVDGTAEEVAADLPVVETVLLQIAREVRRADDAVSREALWRGRLQAAQAIVATGQQHFLCDSTVSPSRVPALQQAIAAIAARNRVSIPTLGHLGDGNLHPVILFDGESVAQRTAAEKAHEELIEAALAMGGTITGEHGVGSEKLHTMAQRFSPAEIAAMRAVKAAFDPSGLLNPGIVLPPALPAEPAMPHFATAARDTVAARLHNRPGIPPVEPVASAGENAAITIDVDNRTVTIGAGMPLSELHAALALQGLQLPLPHSSTTVGNLVSDGAKARAAVREHLLGVSANLPDGFTARFGSSLLKDVAGYDLKRLFTGSGAMFGSLQDVTFQVHVESSR